MNDFLKLSCLPTDLDALIGGKISPLAYAISKCDQIGADILLAAGANPNLPDLNGTTPLMASIVKNLQKTVHLLVLCEADVNKKDMNGKTALMYAVELGNEDIIQLLLCNGASSTLTNAVGDDALMLASDKGDGGAMEILLEDGADVHLKNFNQETALLKAARKTEKTKKLRKAIGKLIESGTDLNAQNSEGETPLMMACKNDDVELMQALIESGADPHIKNKKGKDISNIIADRQSKTMAEKLKEMNVRFSAPEREKPILKRLENATWHIGDPTQTHIKGSSALDEQNTLVSGGTSEKESNSFVKGAPRNPTPLTIVKGGVLSFDEDDFLISGSFSNPEETEKTASALNEKIPEFTIKGIAEPDEPKIIVRSEEQKNEEDRQLMAKEFGEGFKSQQLNLTIRNKLGQTPVMLAVTLKNLSILKALITGGFPTNEKDSKGNTALSLAAESNFIQGIDYLLELKSDIETKNDLNQTPLWIAISKKQYDAAKLLLSKGANQKHKVKTVTTLMLAASTGSKQLVQMLLEADVDQNATDAQGKTAADYAASNYHTDLTTWLLSGDFMKKKKSA